MKSYASMNEKRTLKNLFVIDIANNHHIDQKEYLISENERSRRKTVRLHEGNKHNRCDSLKFKYLLKKSEFLLNKKVSQNFEKRTLR